eukprot:570187-Amphidinium_carterae.1
MIFSACLLCARTGNGKVNVGMEREEKHIAMISSRADRHTSISVHAIRCILQCVELVITG